MGVAAPTVMAAANAAARAFFIFLYFIRFNPSFLGAILVCIRNIADFVRPNQRIPILHQIFLSTIKLHTLKLSCIREVSRTIKRIRKIMAPSMEKGTPMKSSGFPTVIDREKTPMKT